MGRLAGLALLILCSSGCAIGASHGSLAARSPSPSAAQATAIPTVIADSPAPSPAESPSPPPTPSPVPDVACQGGGGASSMVLMQSRYPSQQQLYDVSDPLHPRLLCRITNTTAHLFTDKPSSTLKPVPQAAASVPRGRPASPTAALQEHEPRPPPVHRRYLRVPEARVRDRDRR